MKELIGLLLILLLIVLTLKKRVYGFCLFLIVRILVPENVRLFSEHISLNTSIILVLMLLTLICGSNSKRKIRYNRTLMAGILIFLTYTACTLVLSDYINLIRQIKLLLQFVVTDIIPVVLCVEIVHSEKDAKSVIKSILGTSIIVCIYGGISYLIKSNPYLLFWNSMNSTHIADQWYGNFTSSTFVSTNSFGYFIGLAVPFIFYLYRKGIYKQYAKIALLLLIICSYLCKKRTTIIVLAFFAALLLISSNKKTKRKFLVFGVPVLIIATIIVFTVPSLENFKNMIITSLFFWNDAVYNSVTSGNGGSNWWLRMNQFIYPFVEIKDNYIFGHGFGWCTVYLQGGIIHPVLYGFETIIAQLICEYGLSSLIVFPLLMKGLYGFVGKNKDRKYILIFILTAFVQMVGTGAIYWYLVLILLMLMRTISMNIQQGE